MQTFLPYEFFTDSANSLDIKRLGKQRVEVLQILNICEKIHKGEFTKPNGKQIGFLNHPAVKMWLGHEAYLIGYGQYICTRWINLGYKDSCFDKIVAKTRIFRMRSGYPSWLGNKTFHDSHKLALIQKGYENFLKTEDDTLLKFYRNQWPELEIPNKPTKEIYVWPSKW